MKLLGKTRPTRSEWPGWSMACLSELCLFVRGTEIWVGEVRKCVPGKMGLALPLGHGKDL